MLRQAKAELEEILRQLREEEMERMLAMLETRLNKMLEMQMRVYDDTRRLDRVPAETRTAEFDIEAGKLSFSERKILVEAEQTLNLLKEEGSSVAFPQTVATMIDDIDAVVRRLGEAKTDRLTQGDRGRYHRRPRGDARSRPPGPGRSRRAAAPAPARSAAR